MSEKILSVFIDESGDFGLFEPHCPFYLVTMVLHNQAHDISTSVASFDDHLRNSNFPIHAIHAGPLIRREGGYLIYDRSRRQYLFNALFHFARKLDFQYLCCHIEKSKNDDRILFTAKLSKLIAAEITRNAALWKDFDKVIIYYDNGQTELTRILTSVFSILLNNIEFRKVKPVDYKLFQIADMVCTLELLNIKVHRGMLSKSELDFFGSRAALNKNYLKSISKKKL